MLFRLLMRLCVISVHYLNNIHIIIRIKLIAAWTATSSRNESFDV